MVGRYGADVHPARVRAAAACGQVGAEVRHDARGIDERQALLLSA